MRDMERKPTQAKPNRLGPLAKLPVFLDLKGRRVVVAGGSAAAAWKAELLAAAGGNVEVYAAQIGADMTALLERGAAAGSLVHRQQDWSAAALDQAVLAVADAQSPDEARAFYQAAVGAGASVNVIDQPAYCQFQFGSIVNRSPVVIGISTDGAAPILGQAIRRRIETLLPPALAEWGRLAKHIRRHVSDLLTSGAQRRAFWEHFAARAFGPAPTETERLALLAQADVIGSDMTASAGRVTLVGAGPGDPDLLTLKAVRALQAADVILFDDLVSDGVLELARREAKRMLVGKRGGRASCAQGDINALMVKLARQGKNVVRLKSGDPSIFGRSGEEIAQLQAEGIPVSVVAGITAASAMSAGLCTSLTHRDHAQSVRFVTGHSRHGALSDDLDWEGLAKSDTTLVFYMGARTAPQIAERLMARGLAAQTAAVIVSGVTRPDERRWLGTLDTLGQGIATFDLSAPIIVGIGDVFAAGERIATAPELPTEAMGQLLATA